MTYKEHLIFIDVRRDAGDCFWLPLASVCWNEEGKKQMVSIKGRPQDRFVHATEAEKSAFQIACEWVDNRLRNRPSVKISVI